MDYYPFDVHECSVKLTLAEDQLPIIRQGHILYSFFFAIANTKLMANLAFIKIFSMEPGSFTYNGSFEKDEYVVSNNTIFLKTWCDKDHIFLSLQFERSLLGFFLTVCLPTLIANFIGHTTNYFGDNKFDVAIGVNLTLLLVITTM